MRGFGLVVACGLVAGGCLSPSVTHCGDVICAANDKCDEATGTCIPPECGDGTRDTHEECDPGMMQSSVACTDLGFYDQGAVATCTATCLLDKTACTESCGDHVKNGPEFCDGAPPDNKTCLDFGYSGGRLACSSDCGPRLDDCTSIGTFSEDVENASLASIAGRIGPPLAMYAGGAFGNIWRSDGTAWTHLDGVGLTTNVTAMFVAPETDEVFAVTSGGEIGHAVAGTWTVIPQPTSVDLHLFGLWGTSATDVTAVGAIGTSVTAVGYVLHWDGAAWSAPLALGATVGDVPRAITGNSAGDLVVVGDRGLIAHYDHATTVWSMIYPGGPTNIASPSFIDIATVPSVLASATGYFYIAVGDHGGKADDPSLVWLSTDGVSWIDYSAAAGIHQPLRAVSGTSDDAVYIGGSAGVLLRFDLTAPAIHTVQTSVIAQLNGIFMRRADDMRIVASDGNIFALDTIMWVDAKSIIANTNYTLQGVSGTGTQALYAVGANGTVASSTDGVKWTPSQTPMLGATGVSAELTGAWSSPGGTPYLSAFTAGIYEQTGPTTWVRGPGLSGTTNIQAVWGPGDAETPVYAVGNNGHLWKRDAGTWAAAVQIAPGPATDPTNGPNLTGIWGSSTSDIFVVGLNGTILHYDGGSWTPMTSGVTIDLAGVWGTSTTDVYAVGFGGLILHWDGATWRLQHKGNETLKGVFGTSPVDVFAFGTDAIFHWNGVAWSRLATPLQFQILAATQRVFGDRSLTTFVGSMGDAVTLDRPKQSAETHCADGWDNDFDGKVDCADEDCATDPDCVDGGGECRIQAPIACGDTIASSTFTGIGRIDLLPGLTTPDTGPEATYRFDAPATAKHVTLTLATAQPLDLLVAPTFAGTAACNLRDPGVKLSPADTTMPSRTLEFDAAASTTYSILVDEAFGQAGDFTLTVTCN